MNYKFRVRSNDGRVVLRPHIRRREVKYDTFSLPERKMSDSRSHETIIRPPFKSLEGAAEKYLEKESNPKVKTKSLFSRFKG